MANSAQGASGGGGARRGLSFGGGSKGAQSKTVSNQKPRNVDRVGSLANPLYGRREIKHFPVSHSELRQLGERRNTGTIFLTIGTGFLGTGAGLMKDTIVTDAPKSANIPLLFQQNAFIMQKTAPLEINWQFLAASLILFGLFCILFGSYSIWAGRNLVKTIETETNFPE